MTEAQEEPKMSEAPIFGTIAEERATARNAWPPRSACSRASGTTRSGRPYHGSRPGESGVVLGKPFRCPLRTDSGVRPGPGESRGRSGGRQLPGQYAAFAIHSRCTLLAPTRWRRRTRTRCMQGMVVAGPPARSDHAGRVRVLRGSRAVRRLHRRGLRDVEGDRIARRWVIPKLSSCAITGC